MPRLGTDLEKENYKMALQQRKYMKRSRRNLYIALEDLDLLFDGSFVGLKRSQRAKPKEWLKINMDGSKLSILIYRIDR
ncbi:helix-turn-helix domain-containing protein [Bacillus cereus]|uniref:helix-turn-helix domain-containing protein n=1 Tax=Bacillus cereus TaxID=1396 RepID=UPI001F5B8102|nr:helix-turn-helix domain-containing protein [Bacillus cereus]